jgi:hypothetical protein
LDVIFVSANLLEMRGNCFEKKMLSNKERKRVIFLPFLPFIFGVQKKIEMLKMQALFLLTFRNNISF